MNRQTDPLNPRLARSKGAKTSADTAYEVIVEAILSGQISPGSKLSRRRMAQLTGVSIVPVIEALHRLEDEGLVESYPYYGSQVIQLNDETIQDRYALREAVECQVARILALHMTPEQEHSFRFLAGELDVTSRDEERDTYWNRHYRFHLALAEAAGRPSLERALHQISLFQLLQRSLQKKLTTERRFPPDLHMRIVDGIATGDPDHAEKSMRDHIYFSGIIHE